jgi:putative transposase
MIAAVCAAVGVSRATVQRTRAVLAAPPAISHPRPRPARALTEPRQKTVLDVPHAPRFADQAAKRTDAATSGQRAQAPAEIYATLLDEGVYHCSIRTMYRILDHNDEIRERRRRSRHPVYQKPELLAEHPNEVWSCDITKLMGPTKWSYFYLYVILDIFSRRVVGWRVADAESATLFQPLFDDAIEKHNVPPGQLTSHADRGGPMKAKATAFLLADLGVTRSHNRPHTSNDNPFSESHFKTLKYQPRFPRRFGCIEDARGFRRQFFDWYNQDHHHAGIGLMTPDQVHYGQIDAVHAARQITLDQAFRENPARFVKRPPVPPARPTATWINPPTPKAAA